MRNMNLFGDHVDNLDELDDLEVDDRQRDTTNRRSQQEHHENIRRERYEPERTPYRENRRNNAYDNAYEDDFEVPRFEPYNSRRFRRRPRYSDSDYVNRHRDIYDRHNRRDRYDEYDRYDRYAERDRYNRYDRRSRYDRYSGYDRYGRRQSGRRYAGNGGYYDRHSERRYPYGSRRQGMQSAKGAGNLAIKLLGFILIILLIRFAIKGSSAYAGVTGVILVLYIGNFLTSKGKRGNRSNNAP